MFSLRGSRIRFPEGDVDSRLPEDFPQPRLLLLRYSRHYQIHWLAQAYDIMSGWTTYLSVQSYFPTYGVWNIVWKYKF
jgi:hypothetical protein